jgi:serine/threonine protein kinase
MSSAADDNNAIQQIEEFDYQLNEEFENGRYVLIGHLGHGSYGKVFLVHDKQTNAK